MCILFMTWSPQSQSSTTSVVGSGRLWDHLTGVFPELPSCSQKHLQSHFLCELIQLSLPCSTSRVRGKVEGGRGLHICSSLLSSGFSCNENRPLILESFFCLFTIFQVRILLSGEPLKDRMDSSHGCRFLCPVMTGC